MCSLCRPPSQLLFSLLYCFHSHDSADCTAATIQCPQTKSIYWDRAGAPETPELCPPLSDGGVGLLAGGDELCAEFPLQLCDRIPKPKAILKSDNATAPTERSSPPGFKLLQMFGESGHEADGPLWPTSQARACKSVSGVSVTSWKLTE